jgi:arylsulfatase A-like enzyme
LKPRYGAAVSVLFASSLALPLSAANKPNILLILSDDMGYADIGVHGCKDIPTPNIDAIAAHGVRATSGYVSGPYCSPTRAGLMTGRYQHRFGHEYNPGPEERKNGLFGLSLDETTIAARLKSAGYTTGMVGKWHLGYANRFHPMSRGFDEFYGFLAGGHSYVDPKADDSNPILRGFEPVDEREYLTDAFGREALAFVDRHKQESWFLYWTFNAVHVPLQAPAKYLDRFKAIEAGPRRTYAAMLSAMDDAIGAVVARLRALGLEDNTLIFFVNDNGGPGNGSSNSPLRGYKVQTWEGGIRVPFIVQWKGTLPAGKVYDRPVIQLDVLPTALAAAGVKIQPEWKLDGVDLLPYFKEHKSGPPHDVLFWRLGEQMAVRMGDWKLVKSVHEGMPDLARGRGEANTTGAQLFNLATDIGEKNDLAAREPARVRELEAVWKKWNAALERPRWAPVRPSN